MAVVFFVTSFSLAIFAKQRAEVAGEAGIPTVQESTQALQVMPARRLLTKAQVAKPGPGSLIS